MDAGVEESEKSAGGFDEPPQEASSAHATRPEQATSIFEKEVIWDPPGLPPGFISGFRSAVPQDNDRGGHFLSCHRDVFC
jgi:hypothetical protein